VGSGSLSIVDPSGKGRRDHRLYSGRDIVQPDPSLVIDETRDTSPPSIRALGVSLVTLQGVGKIMVRLRSFSVFWNESLP
jgi:hypothetical protein